MDHHFSVGKLYLWRPTKLTYFENGCEWDLWTSPEDSFVGERALINPTIDPVVVLEINHLGDKLQNLKVLTSDGKIGWIRINIDYADEWKMISS